MGRPRLSHETKTRLLDEGVASLIGQGYHGTGIKEVLDQVKVPKGSFYNYLESKKAGCRWHFPSLRARKTVHCAPTIGAVCTIAILLLMAVDPVTLGKRRESARRFLCGARMRRRLTLVMPLGTPTAEVPPT